MVSGVGDVDLHPCARQRQITQVRLDRSGQPRSGTATGTADLGGRRGEVGPGAVQLGQSSLADLVVRDELVGAPRHLVAVREHLRQRVAVLAPQLHELVTALAHLCEAFVVGLDDLGQVAELRGAVGELRSQVDQPAPDRPEQLGVAQRRHRPGDQVVGRPLVAEQRRRPAAPPAGG